MRILRGIFHLVCTLRQGERCPKAFVNDCRHGCIDCDRSRIVAMSLDNEEVREIKAASEPQPDKERIEVSKIGESKPSSISRTKNV